MSLFQVWFILVAVIIKLGSRRTRQYIIPRKIDIDRAEGLHKSVALVRNHVHSPALDLPKINRHQAVDVGLRQVDRLSNELVAEQNHRQDDGNIAFRRQLNESQFRIVNFVLMGVSLVVVITERKRFIRENAVCLAITPAPVSRALVLPRVCFIGSFVCGN